MRKQPSSELTAVETSESYSLKQSNWSGAAGNVEEVNWILIRKQTSTLSIKQANVCD